MGEALIDVFRPREDGGAYWESIGDTWHMPIGTILIFSLFANNVRTAGQIRMGDAPIDVFRPREDDGAYCLMRINLLALGTFRLAQILFLAFRE